MIGWFRLYTEVLHDHKVQTLPPDLFKIWVNILCIASEHGKNGILPDANAMQFALRLEANALKTAIKQLKIAGLIDQNRNQLSVHAWEKRQYKSDSSTDRVKRFRKRKCNVSETPPDTDTDTEIEDTYVSSPLSPPKADFDPPRTEGTNDDARPDSAERHDSPLARTHPEPPAGKSRRAKPSGANGRETGGTAKPRRRIEADWEMDESNRALCRERGIDPAQFREEFVSYWLGRGDPRADWQQTCRNRLLSGAARPAYHAVGGGASYGDKLMRANAAVAAMLAGKI